MDPQVFRSFVKTALALQLDDHSTPPGYREARAAAYNRYPDLDRPEARPNKTIDDPEQVKLAAFIISHKDWGDRRYHFAYDGDREGKLSFRIRPMGDYDQKLFESDVDHIIRMRPSLRKVASTARHLMELGGLGTLTAPAVQELRHKPMSEKSKAVAEVAGLGTLAAPYVYDLAKAHPPSGLMARAVSRFHR